VLARFIRSANTYVSFLREQSLPLSASLDIHTEVVTVAIEAA
jgi:hypothetical protein